jgi:site-specific recombinase XerD
MCWLAVETVDCGDKSNFVEKEVDTGEPNSIQLYPMAEAGLRAEATGDRWSLTGAEQFGEVNQFLGHLADRNYSPRTLRAYAYDLLALCRWLESEGIKLDGVTTDVLLRFLSWCREASVRGRNGGNVYSIRDGQNAGFAPSTINRRMAAISALFGFITMRDPSRVNPMPRRREGRVMARGERSGMLGHLARPKGRSPLRLRQPRRLPRGLDRGEVASLVGSLRTWRDRAIAGLMLYSGLRSAEVLSLQVRDVDIGRRWVRVVGKGDKERRVPIDMEVAGVIQTYLLAERPDTTSTSLFVVAKGPHRGQPLTPAGLRTVFRYHRARSGVPAGNPHALRHTFGTALAEAGVDLAVMQALLGHDHVDSTAAYIHLAPGHIRKEFDAARARQRSRM